MPFEIRLCAGSFSFGVAPLQVPLPHSFTRAVVSLFLGLATVGLPSLAPAQDVDVASERAYCEYLRQQASAEAAPLRAPEVVVQALRFPDTFGAEGTTWGRGFQSRVGLSYSPTDLFRGIEVENLGDARCRAHQLETQATASIDSALVEARVAALTSRLQFLERERDSWQAVERKTEQRLTEQLITRREAIELRRRVRALEEDLLETEGELALLSTRRTPAPGRGATTSTLVGHYMEAEVHAEHIRSSLRRASAWQLKLTGGVIPTPGTVDWYSIAELRVNLGIPWMNQHLTNAEAARGEALRHSARELPARLSRVKREATAIRAQSQSRLALVERQLAGIEAEMSGLSGAELEGAEQLNDSLKLERVAAEAERTTLINLVKGLEPLVRDETP